MTKIEEYEYNLPSDKEITQAIKENNIEILKDLCIPLGKQHENWRFAQDICVKLSDHENEGIRASALLGLSMTVMRNLKIEKNIIKPVLLRGLKDESEEVRNAAKTTIQDINSWMKWNIGQAQRNKSNEKRYQERKSKKS